MVFAITEKDSIPVSAYRQFQFHYSNDLLHNTDRYLTQVALLKYIQPLKESGSQNEFALQQNVYTPSDIFGDTIQKNDRPYTALLFGSFKRTTCFSSANFLWSGQINAGVIGKSALGEQMQRGVHYAVNNSQPRGWQYQLSDAPFINAKLAADKGLIVRKHIEYIIQVHGNMGTVFNDVSVAHSIRFHIRNSHFNYLNSASIKSFRVSICMKNELKLVAYNGTLQGGIGSRNNTYILTQDQISPFVYYQQIDLYMVMGPVGITLSESYITKEFKTGLTHQWSTLVLSYIF